MAARADLNRALKAGGRGASGEPRAWFRSALVVGQVALSLMLLVSGGLFVRSLDHARQDTSWASIRTHVLVASAIPGDTGYDPAQRSGLFHQRARSRPDVARCRARRMGGLDSDGDCERWRALLARKPASESRRATAECRDGARRSRLLRRRQHIRFSKAARSPIATTRVPRRSRSSTRHSPPNSGRIRTLLAASSSCKAVESQVVGVVPNGKYLLRLGIAAADGVSGHSRQSAPLTSDAGRAQLTRDQSTSLASFDARCATSIPRSSCTTCGRWIEHLVERGRWVRWRSRAWRHGHERVRRGRRPAGSRRSLRDDRGPRLATHAGVRRAHRARRRSRRHPARRARPRHPPDLDWHRRWRCPGGGRGAGTLHAVARCQSVRPAHLRVVSSAPRRLCLSRHSSPRVERRASIPSSRCERSSRCRFARRSRASSRCSGVVNWTTGLDEEIRGHLELLAAEYERRGMTPAKRAMPLGVSLAECNR